MKPSRVRWDQLPDSVHHRVAEILGSPVSVDHVQTHGTTPGVASRVVTADGSHAFVKIGHPASMRPSPASTVAKPPCCRSSPTPRPPRAYLVASTSMDG
ncbi:hypothetical protein JCM18916_2268 [Cutibacterium acnes JCM 18916]|nr:hypothetical protein JCM18916_2268 [Cutibacterium acnes JCM 18916]